MNYIIGNAWSDENGRSSGGIPGDQKQTKTPDYSGEVRLQPFYVSDKGWIVERLKSEKHATKAAKLMIKACNNTNLGYSQSDRYGVIEKGIKSKKPINCDCSTLVRECIQEATGKKLPDFSTANEVSVLERSGLFQPAVEYTPKMTLYTGDVLVTKTKGHTAIVTDGFPRVNPYMEPVLDVTSKAIIKALNLHPAECLYAGEGVLWVQYELCRVGFQLEIDQSGGFDGVCGAGTVACIREFQQIHGLKPDGICGRLTRKALKKI